MPAIEIYTETYCSFAQDVKAKFDSFGIGYTEINLCDALEKRTEMVSRSKGKPTVPQVFFDGQSLGGSDELNSMHQTGQLDLWFDLPLSAIA